MISRFWQICIIRLPFCLFFYSFAKHLCVIPKTTHYQLPNNSKMQLCQQSENRILFNYPPLHKNHPLSAITNYAASIRSCGIAFWSNICAINWIPCHQGWKTRSVDCLFWRFSHTHTHTHTRTSLNAQCDNNELCRQRWKDNIFVCIASVINLSHPSEVPGSSEVRSKVSNYTVDQKNQWGVIKCDLVIDCRLSSDEAVIV